MAPSLYARGAFVTAAGVVAGIFGALLLVTW